jgi:hypothetical protein
MTSLSVNVSEPSSLLAVVSGVEKLIGDCVPVSGELSDAWEIALVRLKELQRSMRSFAAMQHIDDRLIQLGLVGPEMDFRSTLFRSLCERPGEGPCELPAELAGEHTTSSGGDSPGALRIASSVLQTMSRIELFGDDALALAGFIDAVLAAGLIQESSRRTDPFEPGVRLEWADLSHARWWRFR